MGVARCCCQRAWLVKMQCTAVLVFVLAVVVTSAMTEVVFPEEETEAGECLPLYRCCHLARIWRERHQRQGGVQSASEILENARCGFRGHQPLFRCMNSAVEEFPVDCR